MGDKNIPVGETKFNYNGQPVTRKRFCNSSYSTEKFKQENAIRMWAQAFDDLGLDYSYKPTLSFYGSNEPSHTADFFLADACVPVFVRGETLAEANYADYDAKDLALAIEGDVLVAYTDGKFKLMCYFTKQESKRRSHYVCEEEFEIVKCAELSDGATLNICPKCGKYYFTTDKVWQGCRHCGHLTAKNIWNGSKGVK